MIAGKIFAKIYKARGARFTEFILDIYLRNDHPQTGGHDFHRGKNIGRAGLASKY